MIYLDNAATTQIDPKVLKAMMPYLTDQFGNPGTVYNLGRQARSAVENARAQVARFLNCEPDQVIFTSGGTEANNMVFTISQHYLSEIGRKHILISAVEHQSVLKSAQNLCIKHGFQTELFPVGRWGKTSSVLLRDALKDNTGLVSVMYMNNEIGLVNAVNLIAKACHENGTLFHTDCVQAAGSISIDVQKIGCDFASISAHKIHGPKGVGALYIKDKSLFEPMILGGSNQEFGMRGGTENVAGIVGFGAACELLMDSAIDQSAFRIDDMKHLFFNTLCEHLTLHGFPNAVSVNGCMPFGTKTISLRCDGVDAETLVLMLDGYGVCISAGSACNSKEQVPSHVLKAIGLTDDQARSSFRVSFSRMNTAEEAERAGRIIAECIATLKAAN